jgi:iron complex outermembrane receptor protein
LPSPQSRKLLSFAALGLAAWQAAATEPTPALEEVVVTATRNEQSLLAYAGSITRMSAGDIDWTGATHHSELINQAPGAYIQRGSGAESLTALRSPVLTGAGSCGAFLFLEDGIPLRPVGFCNVNELFEVNYEQASAIEVLRGTGSALYGSNAVHGIINVLNPGPADLPPLGLGLEVGPSDYLRGRLALSGQVGRAATGLALHATHDGGWRDHSGLDEQKLSASLVQPMEQGQLTLRLNATNLDQDTAGFIVGQDAYKDRTLARSNPNPEAYRKAWSVRASAHYLRPLADGDEFDLRLVLRSSGMQFLQHFLLGQPVEKNGQDSAEILLSRSLGLGGDASLTIGVDGELASGSLLQEQDGPTLDGPPAANAIRPAGKQYDYVVDSTLLAPYLQWQGSLGQRLTLTAGLRFEWLEYDYDNRMLDGNTDEAGVPCPGAGCLYTRPADRRDRFTNWGPRLGLNYRLSDSSAAWLAASRGFRPPEATELYRLQRGQTVAELGSERIDGIEAGFRHLGRNVSVELAAFWMNKENIILRDSFGFNVSGGRTRHRGVEYDAGWTIGRGWRIAGSGTWALHTYEFSGGIEQGEQVTRGNDVDTAPRELHSMRLGYDRGRLVAEVEWQHVGPYWANAANTARYPGHDLLNLRLAFRAHSALQFTVRITNLADTAYADRADYAFGDYRYFPGRGRAAFLELAWRRE